MLNGHETRQISKAVQLLNQNKVVAIPTETVYGLAANALSESAVLEIFKIKNRPFFDPLIVHIANKAEVAKYTTSFPIKAQKLADSFWPGPLTLILPKNKVIPALVTSGLPFVGLRVPLHTITLKLLTQLDFPLAAPSANPFGYVSPTTAEHVKTQLGSKIPFILDGGPCSVGLESTIIMFEDEDKPTVLRLGGLSLEAIEACIGKVELNIASHSKPNSPGQLDKHYATRTPLKLINEIDINTINKEKTGAIVFNKHFDFIPIDNQIILSKAGSLEEAARHLFGAMRALDGRDLDLILTETFPMYGLGPAINDRLNRAKG
jgi:L-threonylcarbamoyladenylate synthase